MNISCKSQSQSQIMLLKSHLIATVYYKFKGHAI